MIICSRGELCDTKAIDDDVKWPSVVGVWAIVTLGEKDSALPAKQRDASEESKKQTFVGAMNVEHR
jgi:hypothetical protein